MCCRDRGGGSLMASEPAAEGSERVRRGTHARPEMWSPTDRHILLGVSHPSNDPARHRTFEIRATFDAARNGWVARAGEQNLNEQRGVWELVRAGVEQAPALPTAAACLGHAVSIIVAAVDREADDDV